MHTHDLATLSADERIHGVEGALDRRNIDGRRNSSPPCGTKKKGAACIDACRPPLDVFDCPVRHELSTDDANHYWHLIASTSILILAWATRRRISLRIPLPYPLLPVSATHIELLY